MKIEDRISSCPAILMSLGAGTVPARALDAEPPASPRSETIKGGLTSHADRLYKLRILQKSKYGEGGEE